MAHFQLGQVLDAGGDAAGAAAAYSRAVSLEAGFFVARLHLATLLGRSRDAAAVPQAARALQDAQRNGRWVDANSTPASLRPLVEAAVSLVRRERRAAFEQLLEPLLHEFGNAALARVRKCLSIYLQETVPVYPDPRQRPSFLYFPDLPTQPYFDTSTLDWVAALEGCTGAIQRELAALLPAQHRAERVFDNDVIERDNLRGLAGPPSWTGFYFHRHGERRGENCDACPVTAAALDALPLSRVRAHGPETLFSVFTPGTHLLPHRGVTNTRVVGHLPLIVPDDCALNVAGELHRWQEGRVVVFDDTYEHEAWNRSDRIRVVLIFDLWNPFLADVERAAVARVVESIGDFRTTVDGL